MRLCNALVVIFLLSITVQADARLLRSGGGTLLTMRSFDFTAKFGVNGNIDSNGCVVIGGCAAGRVTQEIADMNYIGIKNIRSPVYNGATAGMDANSWLGVEAPLAAAGVRQHFFLIAASPDPFQTPMSTFISALKSNIVTPYGVSMVTGVSGANEPDTGQYFAYNSLTGIAAANSAQADLYTAIKGDSATHSVPVWMWPVGCGYSGNICGQLSNIGNQTSHCDAGNIHDYYADDNFAQATAAPYLGTIYQTYPRYLTIEQQICNQQAAVTTETGWYTPFNGTDGNVSAADEYTQARLLLMDMFDHAMLTQVPYVYLFTLRGGTANNNFGDFWYGVMHDDGTPKVSGTAIKNLMAILNDSGSNASSFLPPRPLAYSLSGMPTLSNRFAVAKSNGAIDIILWNETPIWQVGFGHLAIPSSSVTVTLPAANQGNVYDPFQGTSPIANFSATNTVSISLNDEPIIVEVGPAPVAPPARFTNLTANNFITTAATIGATVATITPTLANGTLSGQTFSIPSSGSDPVTGDVCPSTGPTNFAVNSATGAVTTAASLTAGTQYFYCVAIAQAGVSNTGYTRYFRTTAVGSGKTVVNSSQCSYLRPNASVLSMTCVLSNTSIGTGFNLGFTYCGNTTCSFPSSGTLPTVVASGGGTCNAYTNSLHTSPTFQFNTFWEWCTGQSGTTETFTITAGAGQPLNFPIVNILETANMSASPDDGVGSGATSTGSTSVSASLTTATANDLVLMQVMFQDVAKPITLGQTAPANLYAVNYQVAGAPGSYSNTGTFAASTEWSASIVGVK